MPIDNSQYTLLLIMSSFSNPEAISALLQDANFHVQEATDLEVALQLIQTTPPDLILLDIDQAIPATTSIIRKLKNSAPSVTIPVLFIVSISNESYIPECLTYDNVDFVTKPYRPEELIIRIQHQLLLLRAERTIRKQNEKLKKALEARDKLYSVIAHDLRAPIGTIKMINSSIEAQKAKIKDPQISKLFEMINETTEEAFNLLENLLRWTRNQNGKTKIYATLFNLTPVARQVVSLFSAIANAKEIELINRIEGKFDIFADEDMIKTVLRNLISNAIKFTYTGGQVELSLADSGDYWTIYVKDNGKGIPKDLQAHLLKSDEYITTYGTHNEKGSGLGLILCRDFIRMNKGKLHFYSQEGIGTTFYFTIPKASSSAEAVSR